MCLHEGALAFRMTIDVEPIALGAIKRCAVKLQRRLLFMQQSLLLSRLLLCSKCPNATSIQHCRQVHFLDTAVAPSAMEALLAYSIRSWQQEMQRPEGAHP